MERATITSLPETPGEAIAQLAPSLLRALEDSQDSVSDTLKSVANLINGRCLDLSTVCKAMQQIQKPFENTYRDTPSKELEDKMTGTPNCWGNITSALEELETPMASAEIICAIKACRDATRLACVANHNPVPKTDTLDKMIQTIEAWSSTQENILDAEKISPDAQKAHLVREINALERWAAFRDASSMGGGWEEAKKMFVHNDVYAALCLTESFSTMVEQKLSEDFIDLIKIIAQSGSSLLDAIPKEQREIAMTRIIAQAMAKYGTDRETIEMIQAILDRSEEVMDGVLMTQLCTELQELWMED